jgi:hypothetical protein
MLVLFSGCRNKSKPEQTPGNADTTAAIPAALTGDQLVERGRYLITAVGCRDCHNPKKMGPRGPEDIPGREFSGYQADAPMPPVNKKAIDSGWALMTLDLTVAVAAPLGVIFSANISSDPSGIGSWPEENFIRAMREGKYKGLENGRPLLVMPWVNFAKFTDADIKGMYAYLMKTEPVNNVVPLVIAPEDINYK